MGRCEEHFEALCGFYGDGNPKAASVRNMNPSEWARVRRALKARAKAADGIGGAGKAATPASAPDGWPPEDVDALRAGAARQLRDTVRGFGTYEGRKPHGLIPDPENPGGSLVRKGPADPLTVWRAMRDAFRGAGIPEGVVEAALPPRPEVDRRPDAIIPRFLEVGAHVEGRERLPPFDSPEGAQGSLPGFEAMHPGLVPAFPLPVEANPFQGAPIWQRLALELLIAARIERRRPSYEPLPVTLQDLIDYAGWNPYRPGRHIPMIRAALLRLRSWTVAHERREWWPISPHALPTEDAKPGDVLPIDVAIPAGMGSGPVMERGHVRELAKRTAPGWRAWVRLNLFWHRYSPSGRLIRATVPEVRRDAGGQIVDAHGRPLTLRRGKAPHWSDPRAIRTGGREANPQAERVPVLQPTELAALGYDGAAVTGQTFRDRLKVAKRELGRLERSGRLAIDRRATDKRGREGWRILLP